MSAKFRIQLSHHPALGWSCQLFSYSGDPGIDM